MTARLIVFAVSEDMARVGDLLAKAGHVDALVVLLAAERTPARHGESLVALGAWSEAAARANVGGQLLGALSLYPRRSILYRLDDTPLDEVATNLDPGIVILTPAAPDAAAGALSGAIDLAGRRFAADLEPAERNQRNARGNWALAAMGAAFVVGLGVAGVNAWNVEIPLPALRVEATQAPREKPIATKPVDEPRMAATEVPSIPVAPASAGQAPVDAMTGPARAAASTGAAPAVEALQQPRLANSVSSAPRDLTSDAVPAPAATLRPTPPSPAMGASPEAEGPPQ